MMRSMFSGVSGLRVHQTRMDVIGNNIANVNTVGYKSQRTTFSDVFSQTLSGATSANDDTGRGGRNAMQVGLGVNISSIDLKMTQGSTQRTDRPFDILVEGDGFLIVSDASGRYYTRAGALRIDDMGNVTIPNGMIVQGWLADAEGTLESGEVRDINLFDPRYAATDPTATDNAQLAGNIPSTTEEGKSIETSIGFYDSLGNYYTMPILLQKDTNGPIDANDGATWKIGMKVTSKSVEGAGGVSTKVPGLYLTDMKGNKLEISMENTQANLNEGDLVELGQLIFKRNGELSKVTSQGNQGNQGGQNPSTELNLTIKFEKQDDKDSGLIGGGKFNDIKVDLSGITQYATRSSIKGKALDGSEAGTLKGYSVGSDGIISAVYTNGDLRAIAQIPIAEFDNPSGLEKQGDNIYAMTSNSGEFDGIGQAGVFSTGVLEMSNVDLAEEFTDMIITQRGFQANSKTITTSDEMLQELVGLKR